MNWVIKNNGAYIGYKKIVSNLLYAISCVGLKVFTQSELLCFVLLCYKLFSFKFNNKHSNNKLIPDLSIFQLPEYFSQVMKYSGCITCAFKETFDV